MNEKMERVSDVATEQAVTMPKPRRRWLQFSLRTLMVLMLLISVPLGWLAFKMRQATEQRAVVRQIEELGGTAVHCGQFEPLEKWPPRVPSWLLNALGDDFFRTINYVALCGSKVTDAELVRLRALPQLRSLYLRGSQVTDAGLVCLPGLTRLEELSLANTRVSDAGLTHLRALTQLRTVNLRNTQVTDAGVAELQKALPNCKIER
jgi:hypothetical protein